jgi:hypothetical protein
MFGRVNILHKLTLLDDNPVLEVPPREQNSRPWEGRILDAELPHRVHRIALIFPVRRLRANSTVRGWMPGSRARAKVGPANECPVFALEVILQDEAKPGGGCLVGAESALCALLFYGVVDVVFAVVAFAGVGSGVQHQSFLRVARRALVRRIHASHTRGIAYEALLACLGAVDPHVGAFTRAQHSQSHILHSGVILAVDLRVFSREANYRVSGTADDSFHVGYHCCGG